MPELPEVETVARDLRGLVIDAEIETASCFWPATLRTHTPATIGPALARRRVESVGRRGKQLVVVLSGDVVLTVHLKMTGQLFVVPRALPLDPHVRLTIAFLDGRELRFRDIRKFGRIGLYAVDPATGEPVHEPGGTAVFAGIGPEPLSDAFTLRTFRDRLRGRRGRLKPLLLDQSFIAGVGNIYADEALWASRLHPLRSVPTLHRDDERRLYLEVRRILAEAVAMRGSSVDDYTAPDGDGSMQERLQVYQRAGQPCGRCGRIIRRVVIGARSTHFCSWCQRLPAADRTAATSILRGPVRRSARPAGGAGRRWTELDGEAALGRTPSEEAAIRARARARARAALADASARAEVAARGRADRTRRAAASRRLVARTGSPGDA